MALQVWSNVKGLLAHLSDVITVMGAIVALGFLGYLTDSLSIYIHFMDGSPALVRYTWPVFTLVILALLILLIPAIRRYRRLQHRIRAHRQIANICRTIAAEIATSTQGLVDLYISATAPPNVTIESHGLALRLLRVYLNDSLNRVSEVFSAYTGRKCAVCVKRISKLGDEEMDWEVETVMRDSTSQTERANWLPLQKVRDNSAYISIIKERSQYFVKNALTENPTYINTRPLWERDFDATLVFACPVLQYGGPPYVGRPMALLCIDNKGGGFDASVCLQYIEALSWHISTLWYFINEARSAVAPTLGE
jgi:hypothetical protein